IEALKPMAHSSSYVAAALPRLLLEAGLFDELIEMALSSHNLPQGDGFERSEVELQRFQFAVKACLREARYSDAARLALKAGAESAGDGRRMRLLQANTDLAAAFLEPGRIQEIA